MKHNQIRAGKAVTVLGLEEAYGGIREQV